MSVTIIYNFEAIQGQSEALLALLQKARDFGITVAGCETWDIYQSKDNPYKLVMVESWESEEAHKAHFEQNVKASGVLDSVIKLMIAPPHGTYFLHCAHSHLDKP